MKTLQELQKEIDKEFDELFDGDESLWELNHTEQGKIKDFFHTSILRTIQEFREATKVERIKERMEEKDGEEKELLKQIFGEAKTPEYMAERRYGFNSALVQKEKKEQEWLGA